MTIAMPSTKLYFKLNFLAKLNFNFYYSSCGKRIREICIINATYWSRLEKIFFLSCLIKSPSKRQWKKKIPWHSFQFLRYIQIFLVPFNVDQMKFLPFEYWFKALISLFSQNKNKKKIAWLHLTFDINFFYVQYDIRYCYTYYVSIHVRLECCMQWY